MCCILDMLDTSYAEGLEGLWMVEGDEIRLGLLRRRMSQVDFAERCGIGLEELKDQLSGEVSMDVVGMYAALEVEREVMESGRRKCWARKAVVNDRLLLVGFGDGSEGRVRKKNSFKPRMGIVLEVEPSEEEGWWKLVGKYRDNGVRLD